MHGHSLISQSQLINGNWVTSFYGFDGHGSVRFLTDSNSTITDSYDYDAFGNLIRSSGTTPNNFLYCGEQFDPNLGFYYLRARYMNPSSGRFWTMDEFGGHQNDPVSLHKYLYAGTDPINKIDPTGHESLGELAQVALITGVLANLAVIGLAFTSASLHGFSIDGAIISVRANFSTARFALGGGVDIIWQKKTGSFFYALTAELGTAPLAVFKNYRGLGFSVTFGLITGMRDPNEMSGWGVSAILPAALLKFLPAALFDELKGWGAMTQLARRASRTNIRDFVFGAGLSSSGPSYAFLGVRSNAFSTLVSYSGSYHPAADVIEDLREIAGPIFEKVAAGSLSSEESIMSNADAILAALRGSN